MKHFESSPVIDQAVVLWSVNTQELNWMVLKLLAVRNWSHSSKTGNKARVPTLTTSIQHSYRSPSQSN